MNGKPMVHDLMPDETYASARLYLLATWGDDPTFFLTGED